MPTYEYECNGCGAFTALRPLSEFDLPEPCPRCESPAPRVMLSAPRLATMDNGRRTAFGVNERAANAPKSSSAHPSGCGCCSGMRSKKAAGAAGGAKSFPSARPWMISH